MIKCDMGNVGIEGSKATVLAELTSLIKGMRLVTTDDSTMTAVVEGFVTPHDELELSLGKQNESKS